MSLSGLPFPVQSSSMKAKGEVCEISENKFDVPLSVSWGRKVINSNVYYFIRFRGKVLFFRNAAGVLLCGHFE